MISEEEKQKYCEASKCKDCVHWHKYCNAECCRTILLNIDPKELEKGGIYFTTRPDKLTHSEVIYYRNHDVQYIRGLLRFRKDRIEVIGKKVLYFHDCSRLDGNMCLDHPDKKPELCKFLTSETAQMMDRGFTLTPNCMFKYKSREVKEDD